MTTCPSCGAENPPTKRFCGDCGASLAPADRASGSVEAAAPHTAASARPDPLRAFVGSPIAARVRSTDGRLAEERRLVTALFADISGFTALAQRVDAEELQEIVDPIVSRLSSIAGSHGGFVEKFAGDALLAVFGAPVAHEDDAERALLTALEMHRELARAREELPDAAGGLTLHVGVDSGHGIARVIGSDVRMDYGVLGDAVIVAQRLESHAPPGETYVGETTVSLARDRFLFEPVGPLAIRGKKEPVSAWRLLGPASRPVSPVGGRPVDMIGRAQELEALERLLDGLGPESGAIAVVAGEPGAGKSTLVASLRRSSAAGRVRWLETRCLSYGASIAYRPWAELVRGFAGVRLVDPASRAAARLAAALAAEGMADVLPYLARLAGLPTAPGFADEVEAGVARLEPEALRRALHEAVRGWVVGLARKAPVGILVEDVHWIDAASLDLLRDVAEPAGRAPAFLCLTARPEGTGVATSIAEHSARSGAVAIVLDLAPLGEALVAELVRELLDGDPPAGLPAVLAERAAGNPYFVAESVRALRDAGALARAPDGTWRQTGGERATVVPETIEGILAERIDRLPPGAARLLGEASVIGRRIRRPVLEGVADDPGSLGARIDQLVAAGFLDRGWDTGDELLVFHHALVQDVAYGRLLRRQRRELHLATADAIEALYGSADDTIDLLARHLYLGGAGARAVDPLVRAATRARGLFANEEAELGFERAAEVARAAPEVAGRLPGILLALGEVRDLRGEYEAAAAVFDEVRLSMNDLRAWRGLAAVRRRQGAYATALELLGQADDALPAGADRREIHLERASTLLFAGRFAEAERAAEAGLTLAGVDADALGSDGVGPARAALVAAADVTTGRLILQLAAAQHQLRGPADATASLRHAQAAEAILSRWDEVGDLVVALRTIGAIHWQAGRLDEAAAALKEALRLAERTGGVEAIAGTLVNLGLVELALGRPEAAAACDRRAVDEFGRVGHASGRMIATANLAEALVAAGALDEAVGVAEEALRQAAALDDPLTAADVVLTLAHERSRRGDHAGAVERAEDAARRFVDLGEPSTAAGALRQAADAARAGGDEKRAGAYEARARSLEGEVETAG